AACANDKETSKENKETTPVTIEYQKKSSETEVGLDFSVTNDGEVIDGGVLKVAMVKDEPFQGIFSWELYEDGYDSDLMSWTSNSIFEVDENFMITDEGIASMKVDQE